MTSVSVGGSQAAKSESNDPAGIPGTRFVICRSLSLSGRHNSYVSAIMAVGTWIVWPPAAGRTTRLALIDLDVGIPDSASYECFPHDVIRAQHETPIKDMRRLCSETVFIFLVVRGQSRSPAPGLRFIVMNREG